MKKTIIAPVDFSASAANAAEYAADLASSISADLTLFHVLEVPAAADIKPLKEKDFEEMEALAFAKLNDLKNALATRSLGKINISVEIEGGKIMPRIKEYCAKKGPFIVVMGMTSNYILGSNSVDAMNYLPYPLIIVPGDAHFNPIHKIGLALDKASVINRHLQFLIKLQHLFSSEVDVLYVNTDMTKAPDPSRFSLLYDELAGLKYKFHSITTDKLEDGMNKLLEDAKVDLLVLIPKFHVFFEFHESQSKKLLLHSNVPVMTIHE